MRRKLLLRSVILAILFSLSCSSYAQLFKAVSIAATTESVALPFKRIMPIHPGVELGLNLITNNLDWTGQQLNAYIGFYHHKKLENSFYVKGEYLFQFRIKQTIALELMLNGGYKRSYNPVETYAMNESTKEFEKVKHPGTSSYFVGLGTGICYTNNSFIEPFIRYECFIETPFIEEVNYLPRSLLKLGIHLKFNSDEK